MAKNTTKAPTPPKHATLTVVSGDEDFRRRREISRIIALQRKNGWCVEKVDGETPGVLDAVMTRNPFIGDSSEKLLVVVSNPEKVDIETLHHHWLKGDGDTVLLCDYDGNPPGNTKFGQLCEELKSHHKAFKSPKEFKRAEMAMEFCISEARSYGLSIPSDLVEGIINPRVIGTDLGLLYFEMQKIAMLAEADGVKEISRKQLTCLAALSETPVNHVQDALLKRNKDGLLRAMTRVWKTHKDNPTMHTTKVIGPAAMQWLMVAHLLQKKADSEEIIAALSKGEKPANGWWVTNIVIPPVRKWTVRDLTRLINGLAETERAVLSGAINPWVILTTKLMGVCG